MVTSPAKREAPGFVDFAGASDDLAFSFEMFPPRSPKAQAIFWREVAMLEPLAPRFVSVTYGAGGSAQDATRETVIRLQRETGLTPAAHMTCANQRRDVVSRLARSYWDAGIRHIVALRGDPPDSGEPYEPHPDGYAYAADLVRALRDIADFDISVAAYPEIHPEAIDASQDIDNLKRKLDAGAARAITQFFFDPDTYFRFVDRARAAGIDAPIVAGIMPILDFGQVCRFAERCNATVPDWLHTLFEDLEEHPDTRYLVAAVAAAELCRQLYVRGVREFHFYTLNRASLTAAICRILRNPVLLDTMPASAIPVEKENSPS